MPGEHEAKLQLLADLVRDYFAKLDAWNGPVEQGCGSGEAEGKLKRAEKVLREFVGVPAWTGTYR
jgi:hypothetical protein